MTGEYDTEQGTSRIAVLKPVDLLLDATLSTSNRPPSHVNPSTLDSILLAHWMSDGLVAEDQPELADDDSVDLTLEDVLRTQVTTTEQVLSLISLGGFLWAALWVALLAL
jgi:hypothetical protein